MVQILPPGINPGEAGEQLYSFNQRNLLTQYQVGAGSSVYNTVAEYSYDGGSNRLQQIDSSGTTPITTTYSNDNAGLSQVLVSNDGTTTTLNLFGLDLIQQDDGSETRTLLVDGLGSARVEMVGNVVETTTTFEPYGKLLAQNGSSGTTYGYTGEQYDAAASLVYLRARYYNPNLKLFMSHDPLPGWATSPASQHGYTYAHNNPVNLTDPSGESVGAVIGAVGVFCLSSPVGWAVCGVTIGATIVLATDAGGVRTDLVNWLTNATIDAERTASDILNQCAAIVETAFQKQPQQEPKPTPEGLGPDFPPLRLPTPTPDNDREKHIALGLFFDNSRPNREPIFGMFSILLGRSLASKGIDLYDSGSWGFPGGLASGDGMGFNDSFFKQAAENAKGIHFNLEAILDFDGISTYTDFADAHNRLPRARGGGITAAELNHIRSNPNLCSKTSFYENGSINQTPNASLNSVICRP